APCPHISRFSHIAVSRPPRPSLFPYTTLFRSLSDFFDSSLASWLSEGDALSASPAPPWLMSLRRLSIFSPFSPTIAITPFTGTRSEEHTSELQSRENLVCRLLLEKKQLSTMLC